MSRYSYTCYYLFFFNDTATTEIYTLSLHDRSSDLRLAARAGRPQPAVAPPRLDARRVHRAGDRRVRPALAAPRPRPRRDRKSTRLNSSHANISYAVFCFKKKTKDTVYISHLPTLYQ